MFMGIVIFFAVILIVWFIIAVAGIDEYQEDETSAKLKYEQEMKEVEKYWEDRLK